MTQSMRRFVQAGFIACMLGSTAVMGADSPQPATTPGATQIDSSNPSKLIESAANSLLSGIDKNRAQFRKDPSGLYKLVGETLLPNFDTAFAAEQVLGLTWRTATPDQRDRFVKAFYNSLLYTYGDAMVDFTADRFKVTHRKVPPEATTAAVETIIKRSGGEAIKVMFYTRKTGNVWKAYNMSFEGVNYIVTYRKEYGSAVKQKGLDKVIAELEARAASAKSANKTT